MWVPFSTSMVSLECPCTSWSINTSRSSGKFTSTYSIVLASLNFYSDKKEKEQHHFSEEENDGEK
jgi:hypothetical protein